MTKIIVIVCCIAMAGVSCLKSDSNNTCPYTPSTVTVPSSEMAALKDYIDTNNIDAVKDPRGFYYKIVSAGSSTDSVKLCSQIQITYTGQLTNDSTFDKHSNTVFVLGSLIEGWKMGIPLLRRGGEIRLYLPPTLGYGAKDVIDQTSGKVVVPKNSILKFDVLLTDFSTGN